MPEREREIVIRLSFDADFLRVRFVRDGKRIIRFTVQYETIIELERLRVVRFDTAHGAAHRDILDWNGTTRHSNPMTGYTDYADAMDAAIAEIENYWERYRFEFLRRRP